MAVAIDIVLLDGHLGAMTQHAFDHRRHLRGRATLQLRVDAGGFLLDMPVNHDPAAAIADVPLGHEVLIPGTEFLAVRGAGGGAFAPNRGESCGEGGIHHTANGFAQGIFFDKPMPDIQKLPVGGRAMAR